MEARVGKGDGGGKWEERMWGADSYLYQAFGQIFAKPTEVGKTFADSHTFISLRDICKNGGLELSPRTR